MEVIDRLSLQKPFGPAASLDAHHRLALESIHQASVSASRVLPIDVKYAAAQSKQLVELYNEQDDEGEVMLLAMILLQLHGVKLPVVGSSTITLEAEADGDSQLVDGGDTAEDDLLNKKKRQRTSPDQLAILEHIFQTDKMPNQQTRVQLADQLGMSSRRVQIWFQNKRAKVKRSCLKPGECESPSELNSSSSSISPASSPSSPSLPVVPQQDSASSSPVHVQAPSSPAAVVPQMGNPLKRSHPQIEAPSTVPSSSSLSPSPSPSSTSTLPASIVVRPSSNNSLNTIIETTTKQLKAQQLFSPLTSPFTDNQPVLTASY